jgi:hypothetical protein
LEDIHNLIDEDELHACNLIRKEERKKDLLDDHMIIEKENYSTRSVQSVEHEVEFVFLKEDLEQVKCLLLNGTRGSAYFESE